MNRNTYSTIRRRADGSLFTCHQSSLKECIRFLATILLLVLIFTAIAMFALIYPTDAKAQNAADTENFVQPTIEKVKLANISTENLIAKVPSIFPVAGKTTSGYGYRIDPFGAKSSEYHPGQDIAAPTGTSVIASADGEVVFAGWQRGYGKIIIINHSDGISTRYAHLSSLNVKLKDFVTRGTSIGKVGSTGRSTGAHLHYEVRINNISVDPLSYFPKSEIK